MARRIPLRTLKIQPLGGNEQIFDYAQTMLFMVSSAQQGSRGFSLDEVIKTLAVTEPIEAAVEQGKDEVVLTDTQWQLLRDKLEEFQFGFAHRELATFGLAIREAPEIGTEDLKTAA